MPRKSFRKKTRRPVKRRRAGRKKRSNHTTLVNRAPFSMHTVFPPRYLTKLRAVYTGYFAAGALHTSTVNGIAYFTVYANSLYTPFNTTGLTYVLTSVNCPNTNGISSDIYNPPIGSTELAVLYNQYRVHSSKISVTVSPENVADTCSVCIFPMGNESVPTATQSAWGIDLFNAQPYSKAKTVVSHGNQKIQTLSHYMPCHAMIGMTKKEYLIGNYVQMGAQPSQNYACWGVSIQDLGSDVNVSKLPFTITLDMFVELTDRRPTIF